MMKEKLLHALEQVNQRVPSGFVGPYLDCTEEFRNALEGIPFKEIGVAFAELEGRPPPAPYDKEPIEDQFYFFGTSIPNMPKIPIRNSRFKWSYELTIRVKYTGGNKYEVLQARIVNQQAYP